MIFLNVFVILMNILFLWVMEEWPASPQRTLSIGLNVASIGVNTFAILVSFGL